jgi:hypothetical protein
MGQEPDEASSRQAAAGVKREGQGAAAAGVKRERGEGDAVPRSATADTVDLTGQVRLATSIFVVQPQWGVAPWASFAVL